MNSEACPVCEGVLTEFYEIPCGHKIHSECWVEWMAKSISCPVCIQNPEECKRNNNQRTRMNWLKRSSSFSLFGASRK